MYSGRIIETDDKQLQERPATQQQLLVLLHNQMISH